MSFKSTSHVFIRKKVVQLGNYGRCLWQRTLGHKVWTRHCWIKYKRRVDQRFLKIFGVDHRQHTSFVYSDAIRLLQLYILAGLPKFRICQLQPVLNCAAWLLAKLPKFSPIWRIHSVDLCRGEHKVQESPLESGLVGRFPIRLHRRVLSSRINRSAIVAFWCSWRSTDAFHEPNLWRLLLFWTFFLKQSSAAHVCCCIWATTAGTFKCLKCRRLETSS